MWICTHKALVTTNKHKYWKTNNMHANTIIEVVNKANSIQIPATSKQPVTWIYFLLKLEDALVCEYTWSDLWKLLHFCHSLTHWNWLESIKVFNSVFLLLPRARRAADWLRGTPIFALIRRETRQSRPLPELRLSARNPVLVFSRSPRLWYRDTWGLDSRNKPPKCGEINICGLKNILIEKRSYWAIGGFVFRDIKVVCTGLSTAIFWWNAFERNRCFYFRFWDAEVTLYITNNMNLLWFRCNFREETYYDWYYEFLLILMN